MLRHFPMNRKDIDVFRCSCAVSDFSQTFLRFVSIFLSVVFPTVSVPFFSDFSNPFFESEQNNLNCYISRIEPYGWGWFLLEAGARFLVVVPVTLLEQWRRELDTWARG